MFKIIETKNAPSAIGPYSQAILVSDTLFASGQIPVNPTNGQISNTIEEQTEQVCKNIEAVLKEAGMDFSNVVKTTCFLADINDFAKFNEIYGKYFISKPARSCVAVKDIPKGCKCEIEIIAKIK